MKSSWIRLEYSSRVYENFLIEIFETLTTYSMSFPCKRESRTTLELVPVKIEIV